MAPLLVLLIVFCVAFLTNKFLLGQQEVKSLIGRLSMAVMLVFTGIAHYTNTPLMEEMIPEPIPFKKELVYLTGFFEIIASIGLVTKNKSKRTSLLLVLFFLAVLPANIVGSMKEVALGGMGQGVSYLYFRIPLQLFFILWIYYFGIRINKGKIMNSA